MTRSQADYTASTSNKFFPRKCGTLEERFWSKVVPEPNTGCWIWCGDTNGKYGSFGIYDKVNKKRHNEYAHRFSYELFKGPIPDHLQVDHECCVKLCVNPDHLRLLTPRQNTVRAGWNAGQFQLKTHCKRGHPLSGKNFGIDSRGYAKCRACANAYRINKRPYVPWPVRIAVLLRQCAEYGLVAPKQGELTDGAYIKKLQILIFGDEAILHLDHDPSLVNREFDEDLRLYSPDANDPNFLSYRTKEEHRIKTFVRGQHGDYSDLAKARKRKRREKRLANTERLDKAQFGKLVHKRPKRKWPSRPFPKRKK